MYGQGMAPGGWGGGPSGTNWIPTAVYAMKPQFRGVELLLSQKGEWSNPQ